MEQANTCPICGQIYSSALCPRCGFENRLMLVSEPNPIIQQIDEQRIEIAKRSWDFAIKLQEEIESLTKENQNAQSQITELNQTIEGLNSQINKLSAVDDENKSLRQELVEQQQNIDALSAERDKLLNEKSQLNKERKELEDRIKDLSDKLSSAHLDNSRLEAELKEKQEGTSQFQKLKDQISDYLSLKKEKEDLKSKSNEWESKYNGLFADMSEAQRKISQIQSQLQSTTKEKEEWKSKSKEWESKYNSLFADMSEAQHKISQIQSQLKSVTEEKERLEDALSKKNNSQTNDTNSTNPHASSPQNRGERKGEVLFTDGQHEIKQDIYTGSNVYLAPQIMHPDHDGDLFTIIENNGVFTIYDNCGAIKKANGRAVREKGEQVTDGDIFSIGLIQIHIILPEIDFNNINF